MRGELHDCLVKMACDFSHHPASVYQASLMAKLAPVPVLAAVSSKAKTDKGVMKFGHIDDAIGNEAMKEYSVNEYRGRYLPINTKKWPVEVGCLKEIIAFCQAKKRALGDCQHAAHRAQSECFTSGFSSALRVDNRGHLSTCRRGCRFVRIFYRLAP